MVKKEIRDIIYNLQDELDLIDRTYKEGLEHCTTQKEILEVGMTRVEAENRIYNKTIEVLSEDNTLVEAQTRWNDKMTTCYEEATKHPDRIAMYIDQAYGYTMGISDIVEGFYDSLGSLWTDWLIKLEEIKK